MTDHTQQNRRRLNTKGRQQNRAVWSRNIENERRAEQTPKPEDPRFEVISGDLRAKVLNHFIYVRRS